MGAGEADDRSAGTPESGERSPFHHSAFLYADHDDFLAGASSFIDDALDHGEPVLISVPAVRLHPLQEQYASADLARFVPMEDLGRNPAWIIPAWTDFVTPHIAAGHAVRGIGEPIWPGRTADELVECHRHEELLNVAMRDCAGFSLLCPYDTRELDDAALTTARENHGHLHQHGDTSTNPAFVAEVSAQLSAVLRDPPAWAESVAFDRDDAWSVRRKVAAAGGAAGLDAEQLEDLAVATSEALTNTVEHGGGSGEILWWSEPGRFLCEIRDHNPIADPLVGRVRPDPTRGGGRGMWLIHQLCDLVQIREPGDGTKTIRLHLAI